MKVKTKIFFLIETKQKPLNPCRRKARCQFYQHVASSFFDFLYQKVFHSCYVLTVWVCNFFVEKKFAKKLFVKKLIKFTPVVNFINILQAAFAPLFFCQKIQSQTVISEKLRKTLSYGKCTSKMLMKLTPGVGERELEVTISERKKRKM